MRRTLHLAARSLVAALLFGVVAVAGPSQPRQAAECERKLQYIQSNGAAQPPSTRPTLLTEDEINAYFAEGKVQLPQGVQRVIFEAAPSVITAHARVDFDQITAGKRATNPLLSLFSGVHDIDTVADAHGAGGVAVIHIRSVSLDGTTIPRVALEYFVNRYIKPKHPEIGLDTRFQMPYRIDRAEAGGHSLTIRQR